jgi:NADH:ubiquinone oxidoreductase subunit 6 (subunit J)
VPGLLFAADTLKASFAIVGAVFVVWAAVIAGLGLSRSRFPGGAGGQRAVMAVTIILAAVVMGVAVQTA